MKIIPHKMRCQDATKLSNKSTHWPFNQFHMAFLFVILSTKMFHSIKLVMDFQNFQYRVGLFCVFGLVLILANSFDKIEMWLYCVTDALHRHYLMWICIVFFLFLCSLFCLILFIHQYIQYCLVQISMTIQRQTKKKKQSIKFDLEFSMGTSGGKCCSLFYDYVAFVNIMYDIEAISKYMCGLQTMQYVDIHCTVCIVHHLHTKIKTERD